jgi:hypothetical protein
MNRRYYSRYPYCSLDVSDFLLRWEQKKRHLEIQERLANIEKHLGITGNYGDYKLKMTIFVENVRLIQYGIPHEKLGS